jgi:hypothetical protein
LGFLRVYIVSILLGFDVEGIGFVDGEINGIEGTDGVNSDGDSIEGDGGIACDGTDTVLVGKKSETSSFVGIGVFSLSLEDGVSLFPSPESISRLRTFSSWCTCSSTKSTEVAYNFKSLS